MTQEKTNEKLSLTVIELNGTGKPVPLNSYLTMVEMPSGMTVMLPS